MKSKYYNIFFTSEKDGFGKSFRVSNLSLLMIMFFLIATISLSYLGFARIFGQDKIINELTQLRNYKYITSILLNESGITPEIVDSNNLEKIIVDYIIANNMIYPEEIPVDGYVTEGVLKNKDNVIYGGVDIASKSKEKVRSPLSGMVVSAKKSDDLGNTIILHHQNDFFTIYGYLDTILVKPRDLISKDEIIGRVAGDNAGPHLYFEVWKGNQIIDPRNLISDYKEKDVSIR